MRLFFSLGLLLACSGALQAAETPAAASALTVRAGQREILLTGCTHSRTSMLLSSEVSGRLSEAAYDVGDQLDDRPAFRIDPTFVDFEIREARRNLAKLDVAIRRARIDIDYLEKEFGRIDKLFRESSIPESKRDATEHELKLTAAAAEAAGAEKAVLQNQLERLLERRRRHDIYGPRGWVVVEKRVEAGEVVSAQAPLARIADFDSLVVPLAVGAEELAAIRRLGQKFKAKVDEKDIICFIDWINPEFNEDTRKWFIQLRLEDFAGVKRGGLRFALPLEIAVEGVRVPKAAVWDRYEAPRVLRKQDRKPVNLLVLSDAGEDLLVSRDPLLTPGTELLPADGAELQEN